MTAGERLGFDLETTGVDPETARIVSYALVHRRPGPGAVARPDLVRTGLVSGVEIPPDATAVHGITTAFASAYGRPETVTVDFICAELAAAHRRGAPIVGMNLAYDLTLLDRRAAALGVASVCERLSDHYGHMCPEPVYDVYMLDLGLDPRRRGTRKLGALVQHHLGHAHDNAHDAVADVIATLDLADVLVPRWCARFDTSAPMLIHAGLAGTHARHKQYLAAAFARWGKGGRFDPCWPVCHHDRGAAPTEEPPIELHLTGRPATWDDVTGR